MKYNSVEKEVIGLCISLEALCDINNHALLEIREVSEYPGEAEVYFHDFMHQQLFIIRLLDFVKESGDSRLTGVSGSCLSVLQSACATGSFDRNNSIDFLNKSVAKLDEWLHYKTPIKLWLPTLDIEAEIVVSRLDFIAISGNHFKHNLSRLTGVSKHILNILSSNGYSVELEQIPLALDDFREHLQENYFVYYGTWLAELLNNVRWGIQEYLLPVYQWSYTSKKPGEIIYSFKYPEDIKNKVPRSWFWRLMNHIRTGPYFRQFTGAHYLKNQSSLERLD